MIVKKKQSHIKKLQQELSNFDILHKKKDNHFERSKILVKQSSSHKKNKTINLADRFYSTQRHGPSNSKVQQQREWEQFKSSYNRPFHLLKQYLNRKQKLTFMPLFNTNPEREENINKAYNTLNEFRIKKQKKIISFNPNHNTPRINKMDEDFITFNTTKNLYQMTHSQLKQSIKWKKQFLNMLNQKVSYNRTIK